MELPVLGLIIAIVVILLYNTVKVLKEYERGVVFFLGRFQRVKGPGLILLIPFIVNTVLLWVTVTPVAPVMSPWK